MERLVTSRYKFEHKFHGTTKMINKLLTTLAALLVLATSGAFADDSMKLTVGHDLWIGYAGYFVAKDQGYFEEAGLEINAKPFTNPGETLPAMIGGHLDLAMSTLQNITLAKLVTGEEIKLVYLFDTSNGADAIIAKDPITSVTDLKGKVVAATQGEVNHMLLMIALEQNGMTESDIKFINMSADDAGAAFLSGKVDAAVTWEPWVTKATASGGNVVFTSADMPDTILDGIALTPRTLSLKKAAVLAFIEAVNKGVVFLQENSKRGAMILSKALEVSPEDALAMLETDKIYTLADNKVLFNGPALESLSKVTKFLVDNKMVPNANNVETILDGSLVQ
ncbi:MAG: ABC transporter substrate-binding protein [Gammaproteobacteria bacterium]|nr:ABC transporter substrate-binding protein [Gammaproteobacteria bacterium]